MAKAAEPAATLYFIHMFRNAAPGRTRPNFASALWDCGQRLSPLTLSPKVDSVHATKWPTEINFIHNSHENDLNERSFIADVVSLECRVKIRKNTRPESRISF